jgi:D-glycero-beta-D-manno-heptose-7-phosphate kinase
MKILIIGESCRDVFIYGKVDRLEPSAPVPIIQKIETRSNGGMAMNVKSNFFALGVEVKILTNNNWKSITKTRLVEQKANHMFLRLDEGDTGYGNADLKNIDYSQYDAIVISDYNKGFLTKEQIRDICESHNLVFLDTKKPLGLWAESANFIKINNHELKQANQVSLAMKDNLIVTMGSQGALYREKLYPVELTDIKDLSGAGDTFLAGLCVKYCQTKDIELSIKYANECATKVVQKKGVATA